MFSNPTFLIADQNQEDIFSLKEHLLYEFKSSIFLVCKSKEEFDEKIKWTRPDVIFCDYTLPKINAIQFCIQTTNKLAIPLVFVAHSLKHEFIESAAILNTASGFVLKNNLKTITSLTHKLLASKKNEAEKQKKEEANKDDFFLLNDKMGHLLESKVHNNILKDCHSEIYSKLHLLY